MRGIYLTGFMGTGKSTIGRILSSRLGIDIIDTDNYIIDKVGKTISAIFENDGEEIFRNYESEVLKSIPSNDIIVSTGGGIILREENRKYMREHGYVIYLDCDFTIILNRIQHSSNSRNNRPLFQNDVDNLKERFESRQQLYSDADFVVNTNDSIDIVVDKIIEWILEKGE